MRFAAVLGTLLAVGQALAYTVGVGTYVCNPGADVNVAVDLDSAAGLSFVSARISYDPQMLVFREAKVGTLGACMDEDFTVTSEEAGVVTVGLFGSSNVVEAAGSIAVLTFGVRERTERLYSDVTVSDVQIGEMDGVKDVTVGNPLTTVNGMVRIMSEDAAVDRLENDQVICAGTRLKALSLKPGDGIAVSEDQPEVSVAGAVTTAGEIPMVPPEAGWRSGEYRLLATSTGGLPLRLTGLAEDDSYTIYEKTENGLVVYMASVLVQSVPTPPVVEPVVTNTITYVNLQGAVNTNVTQFTTNDLPLALGPVEREGYRFLGWTPLGGVIPAGTVTNVTFAATWEEIVEPPPVEPPEKPGQPVEPPEEPINPPEDPEQPEQPVVEPVVTNTITYVNLQGVVNTNVTQFTTNDLPLALGPVEREGYRFLGWTPQGGVIPAGTVTNVTFAATWEEIVESPPVEPPPVEPPEKPGQPVEPPEEPINPPEDPEQPEQPVVEPVVTNTITYVNLQGAVNTNVTQFTTNDLPLALGPVEREGYRFLGWTPQGGVIPAGTVTNVTFAATWEEIVEPPPVEPPPLEPPEKPGQPVESPEESIDQSEDPEPPVEPPVGPGQPTSAPPTVVAEAETHVDVAKGEKAPYEDAAAVYDGCLYDGGKIVGSVQVKVAKMKSGAAKVTATVQLAGEAKKLSFKGGSADQSGNVSEMTDKNGNKIAITVGVKGLGGEFRCAGGGAPYRIDGARNVFSGKSAADKDAADDAVRLYQGVYNVAFDGGTLSVSVDKKGKAKIAGTVEGNKVNSTSQLVVGDSAAVVPVVIVKKVNVSFCLWIDAKGGAEVHGVDSVISGEDAASPFWEAGKVGVIADGAKFWLDEAAVGKMRGWLTGLYADYLPKGLAVAQSGKKWIVADGAKAGKVAFAKGATTIDTSKLGENPSGLKLSYKEKDGTFKGSFKAYNLEGGKIKSYTVSVTGVMIGDMGYGTATIKKLGAVAVTVSKDAPVGGTPGM